ncbi:MAG: hypothetical protein AAGA75_07250 [Cyanobacteria bacterium P01_E01_bin.6]
MPLKPIGNELPVNQTTEGTQRQSTIATYDDGSFVVAWEGPSVNGKDHDKVDIFIRRFNAQGVPITDDIVVNNPLSPVIQSETNPVVATLPDGGFLVSQQVPTFNVSPIRIYKI